MSNEMLSQFSDDARLKLGEKKYDVMMILGALVDKFGKELTHPGVYTTRIDGQWRVCLEWHEDEVLHEVIQRFVRDNNVVGVRYR